MVDEMAAWHHRHNGCGFEWTPGVGDGQGGLACCGSWGHKELDTTEQQGEDVFSSVQLLSCVRCFATPWTAACQAALSITNSRSLPTNSSFVIPFSSCLQSSPASGSFPVSQFFTSGCQSIGVSALASVFPMNIQD